MSASWSVPSYQAPFPSGIVLDFNHLGVCLAFQELVTFEDVAVDFSPEELPYLSASQSYQSRYIESHILNYSLRLSSQKWDSFLKGFLTDWFVKMSYSSASSERDKLQAHSIATVQLDRLPP